MKLGRPYKVIGLLFIYLTSVCGHGRLMEPVSRASAWRKGFPNPADYNDNEGYCGGYSVRTSLVSIWHVTKINGCDLPRDFSTN